MECSYAARFGQKKEMKQERSGIKDDIIRRITESGRKH